MMCRSEEHQKNYITMARVKQKQVTELRVKDEQLKELCDEKRELADRVSTLVEERDSVMQRCVNCKCDPCYNVCAIRNPRRNPNHCRCR